MPGRVVLIWAVKEMGMSSITVADRLGITQPAVSRLAQRGEKQAIENNLFL
jgi:predicted transcriptional regulator